MEGKEGGEFRCRWYMHWEIECLVGRKEKRVRTSRERGKEREEPLKKLIGKDIEVHFMRLTSMLLLLLSNPCTHAGSGVYVQ